MTSAPQNTDRPGQDRKVDLSLVQVAAGALAAVSSAVAASYFGVAGTLLGAALGSVVGTVGTAVYKASLARTNDKLREIVPIQTVVLRRSAGEDTTTAVTFAGGAEAPGHPAATTGTTGAAPTDLPAGLAAGDATGNAAGNAPGNAGDPPADTAGHAGDAAGSAADAPADTAPAAGTAEGATRHRLGRGPKLALAALAAFAVALGGVGAVEAVAGRSLSSLITGDKSKDETVWKVITPADSHRDTRPAPTATGSPTTTTTPTGTPGPTATPSVTVSPSGTGSPGPTGSPVPTGPPGPEVTPTP